jgi:hypothetical protein
MFRKRKPKPKRDYAKHKSRLLRRRPNTKPRRAPPRYLSEEYVIVSKTPGVTILDTLRRSRTTTI